MRHDLVIRVFSISRLSLPVGREDRSERNKRKEEISSEAGGQRDIHTRKHPTGVHSNDNIKDMKRQDIKMSRPMGTGADFGRPSAMQKVWLSGL